MTERYKTMRAASFGTGVEKLLDQLEDLITNSRPVIIMSFAAVDDIMRPGKYRNYQQRVLSHERDPASPQNHADREMVGQRLYPSFSQHILYAALSPDGRGLMSYGDGQVAVQWNVTAHYLERRISLLEENSFVFYERHGLGAISKSVPIGHRSTWNDRAALAVSKLGPKLDVATSSTAIQELIMTAGTRKSDDFIEIAIYAEEGIDTRGCKPLLRHGPNAPPVTLEERYRADLVRESCRQRRVHFEQ